MSLNNRFLFLISLLPFLAFGLPQLFEGGRYDFADGINDILKSPPPQEVFSCDNRNYGYYGDVVNNCQIFHVCVPVKSNDGESIVQTLQYSFACNNGTLFDQMTLTCNHEQDAFPCASSESIYDEVNGKFGKKTVTQDEAQG